MNKEKIISQNNKLIEKMIPNRDSLKTIDETFDPSKEITVSVICNVYNHEKYIGKCIDAFLMQKVDFNVEILIHDDCSKDGSQKIINEYAKKYPNVIKAICQKENQQSQGKRVFFVFQLDRAKGKYIAICEGDDYWTSPYKLYVQVHALEANPDKGGSTHNTIEFNAAKNKVHLIQTSYNKKEYSLVDASLNKCHTTSLMYKREMIMNAPEWFFAQSRAGDYPMKLLTTMSGGIIYFPYVMSVYNIFSSSSSWFVMASQNMDRIIEIAEGFKRTFDQMDEYYAKQGIKFDQEIYDIQEMQYYVYKYDFASIAANKKLYKLMKKYYGFGFAFKRKMLHKHPNFYKKIKKLLGK